MSLPLRTCTHLAAAATMVVALAGCSAAESTSASSSAITVDAGSTSNGDASIDESASTANDPTSTADAGAATQGSEGATVTAQGPPMTLESDDETFTLDVPAGWKDALDTAPDGTVLAAQSTARTGDSFNTVLVTAGDSVRDLDEVMAAGVETLEEEGVEVKAAEESTIDGRNAYGWVTTTSSGDDTLVNELRSVNFGGSLYTMIFSTAQVEGKTSALADREFDDILDSWSWSERD